MKRLVVAHRALIEEKMRRRNAASRQYFPTQAEGLARICGRMADRFLQGGRLLSFGSGSAAWDAQHVAVEFVHPVLVGKRALPALNLPFQYYESLLNIVRPQDVVMGFSPIDGDHEVARALAYAASRGALTLALPGVTADASVSAPSSDPFVFQELIEVLYHTLWETVHVFLESESIGHTAGAASFLYPFLGGAHAVGDVIYDVAASIRAKAAHTEQLRDQVAIQQSDAIAAAALAIYERVSRGGTVLCFGNGGSATDATDLAYDLTSSGNGHAPVPAVSLSMEPATITAIANDIGTEAIFVRQLVAHARPIDVAVAISTSGGSSNVIAALAEARARDLLTVAIVGYDGGEILRRRFADHVLVVASDHIPRIQEAQASIYHVIVDLLDAIRGGA